MVKIEQSNGTISIPVKRWLYIFIRFFNPKSL